MTVSLLPFLLMMLPAMDIDQPRQANWCEVGEMVMIPDGREGPVTHLDGDYCGVLPYGEKYVTRWAYYLIEPAYPKFGR